MAESLADDLRVLAGEVSRFSIKPKTNCAFCRLRSRRGITAKMILVSKLFDWRVGVWLTASLREALAKLDGNHHSSTQEKNGTDALRRRDLVGAYFATFTCCPPVVAIFNCKAGVLCVSLRMRARLSDARLNRRCAPVNRRSQYKPVSVECDSHSLLAELISSTYRLTQHTRICSIKIRSSGELSLYPNWSRSSSMRRLTHS
jgi:hypothetical protein